MYKAAPVIEEIKKLGFYAFSHDGKVVHLSAEHGDGAADYYGEFHGGYPWINPALNELAGQLGCYWEWRDAGTISLYERETVIRLPYGARSGQRARTLTKGGGNMTHTDPRVGKRCQLHPATDRWMMGDRYGVIVKVSSKVRSYLDPRDPRNGRIFTVKLDKSGRTLRFSEGRILEIF